MYGMGVMAQYAAEHFAAACLGVSHGGGGEEGRGRGGREREGGSLGLS